MEIKTSELTGVALDWAVLVSANTEPWFMNVFGGTLGCSIADMVSSGGVSPSTNWAHGGPLLDIYDIAVNGGYQPYNQHDWGDKGVFATLRAVAENEPFACGFGSTRLIAACRSIVAYELGDTVDVPEGLLG